MDNEFKGPLVRCGLWLHIGFIGASVLVAELLLLFAGNTNWVTGLALAFSGAVLAVTGWRRGRIVLESVESASSIANDRSRRSVSDRVVPRQLNDRAEPRHWIANG